jgi:hypothetical protein
MATRVCCACGTINRAGARFCKQCGVVPFHHPCRRCGSPRRRFGARFCYRCGLALIVQAVAPALAGA